MLVKNVESRFKAYFLLTLLILIVISILQYNNYIFAYSPSFSRLYAADNPVHLNETHVQYLTSATYTSDGRTLSATLWLYSQIYDNQSYDGLRYGIRIWLGNAVVGSAYYPRPIYDIYIEQQRNGTWAENTIEYENGLLGTGSQKPLQTEHRYTGLSNQGSKYINLFLDLDTIGYPDEYHMLSYVQKNSKMLDETYFASVPQTTIIRCGIFCIAPIWGSIRVFPAEISNISIPIYSNQFTNESFANFRQIFKIHLYQDSGFNNHGIKLKFNPDTIEIPTYGFTKTDLKVTTPDNIPNENYTLKVNEFWSALVNGQPRNLNPNKTQSLFNIEVLKSPNLIQRLSQFLIANTVYTVAILLGTTLAISTPLLFYVWKKERQSILIDFKKSEILQINSTVMVGVLILLTLGTSILRHINTTVISLITASIIFPFAISSVMVVISKIPTKEKQQNKQQKNQFIDDYPGTGLKLFPASIMAMLVGFVYIISAVITLAFIG
jgi:hypothetical protein